MIVLTCLTGCRNCLKGDSTRKGYVISDGTMADFPNSSEYETMEYLEEWRSEQNSNCPFCSSENVEVLDVEINDYALYDYDRLVQECKASKGNKIIFMVSMDKDGSKIDVNLGGTDSFRRNFLEYSLKNIVEVVKRRPSADFKTHEFGSFFICVTGSDDLFQKEVLIKTEKYRNCGLSRDEILNQIKNIAIRNNILLP